MKFVGLVFRLLMFISVGRIQSFRLRYAVGGSIPRCGQRLFTSIEGTDDVPPNQTELYAELKAWRRRFADQSQQPVYRVFTNANLETITTARPVSISELGYLSGIGPAKLKSFGPTVLRIVRKHVHADETDLLAIDEDAEFWSHFMAGAKPKVKKEKVTKPKKEKKISASVDINANGSSNSDGDGNGNDDGDSSVELPLLQTQTKTRTRTGGSVTVIKETDTATTSTHKRRASLQVMTAEDASKLDVSQTLIRVEDLNTMQKYAASSALKTGNNIFITGSAGTGKTFLLRYIIQELSKRFNSQEEGSADSAIAVTAPTGISAINVGGRTIHSFAGIGLAGVERSRLINRVLKSKHAVERWENCKVLIIDEISMLDTELFEFLDSVAKQIKGNDMPFGGIQLIAVGDFLQLPPVQRTKDKAFCFQSPLWEAAGLDTRYGTIVLEEVERQKDSTLVKHLNEVRVGKVSDELLRILDTCLVTKKPKPSNGIIPTKLYSVNKEVDAENQDRLLELPGQSVVIEAEDVWKVKPAKSVPYSTYSAGLNAVIPENIQLKVGAQVMLLRNRNSRWGKQEQALVNGSRGKVVSFCVSDKVAGMMVPTIEFDNGLVTTIGPVEYLYKLPSGSEGVIVRNQVPVKLAWAATIHKSQGSTLSCVELMLGNTFDYGQAYVALSRVRDIRGLWLSEPIRRSSVKASPEVLKFYGYK